MTLAVVMPMVHVYTPESPMVTTLISSPNSDTPIVTLVITLPSVTRENVGRVGPVETQGNRRDCPSYTLTALGGERAMDSSAREVAVRKKGEREGRMFT